MSDIRHGIRVRQRALESVRCAGAGVALATLPGSKRSVRLIYTNVIREMVFQGVIMIMYVYSEINYVF